MRVAHPRHVLLLGPKLTSVVTQARWHLRQDCDNGLESSPSRQKSSAISCGILYPPDRASRVVLQPRATACPTDSIMPTASRRQWLLPVVSDRFRPSKWQTQVFVGSRHFMCNHSTHVWSRMTSGSGIRYGQWAEASQVENWDIFF
jgi:hypothetical protein